MIEHFAERKYSGNNEAGPKGSLFGQNLKSNNFLKLQYFVNQHVWFTISPQFVIIYTRKQLEY